MGIPPIDDAAFDYELVDVSTDDEYEFVEAPVVERPAVQWFPPPARETIGGRDNHTSTIAKQSPPPKAAVAPTRSPSPPLSAVVAPTRSPSPPPSAVVAPTRSPSPPPIAAVAPTRSPSPPPIAAVAPTRSPSPPPALKAHAKEEKTASPLSLYAAAAALRAKEPPPVVWQFNLVEVDNDAPPSANDVTAAVATALPPLWYPSAHGQAYGEADRYDEDEDDDDHYDGTYQSCYDCADFGRSRNVKRSSGRRGRTKKKTSMGRPRGEERSSHIAGNW